MTAVEIHKKPVKAAVVQRKEEYKMQGKPLIGDVILTIFIGRVI